MSRKGLQGGKVEDSNVQTLEPSDVLTAEAPADEAAKGGKAKTAERRVVRSYVLPESLACAIDQVAAELDINACDVVEPVMSEGLKGFRRATVPEELKRKLARGKDRQLR